MNKQELVNAVALKSDITKKDAERFIVDLFTVITDTVASGEKVQLVGTGTFEKKATKGTSGTIQFGDRKGETWTTEDSFKPYFNPGKAFSDKVKA
ncbi:MAG TPA: HU family DNA-binding protein [Clostridium sp.]